MSPVAMLTFQCPGGRSGIRSELWAAEDAALAAVSMPWRAFGDSEGYAGTAWDAAGASAFQCPGGRSGIRSYCFGPRSQTREGGVSMPWRAFGDSESTAIGTMVLPVA